MHTSEDQFTSQPSSKNSSVKSHGSFDSNPAHRLLSHLFRHLDRSLLILVLAHSLILTPLMSQDASLRFEILQIEEGLTEVKLMIKSHSDESFSLANQNFRIFYNAEQMSLEEDKVKNNLPSNRYTQPELIEHEQYVSAPGSDAMNASSIGFLNFSVLLLDDDQGGITIDDNWKHIYSLYFKTETDIKNTDITFANSALTSNLATAYVEISEWINPSKTNPMKLTTEPNNRVLSTHQFADVSVGPNPTADFIYIMSDRSLANAKVYNSNGAQMLTRSLDGNESKVDLSNLIQGMYFVEIEDQQGNIEVKEIMKFGS